jgi:hypothetical protein
MGTDPRLYGDGLLGPVVPPSRGRLTDQFLMPPFSVWDAKQGFWQERKRLWLGLGIQSEAGRKEKMTYNIPMRVQTKMGWRISQTSVFDPVVAELCYTWWCRPGGIIVDPFAGGSVRGIVASILGYRYWGCDLAAEQIAANQAQLTPTTTGRYHPHWVCGDSWDEVPKAPLADFLFSCPPYGNLEQYTDNARDISTMDYAVFLARYGEIIGRAAARLRDNRFSAWVVANYRDKRTGVIHDFVGDTIRLFEAVGLRFYNEIILATAIGTSAMRANGTFRRGARKVCKGHQQVLVFIKGDEAAAAEDIPLPPQPDVRPQDKW